MASLLRSQINVCARRVPYAFSSSPVRVLNGGCALRATQRRFASSESFSEKYGGGSAFLPIAGLVSLGLVGYVTYDIWKRGTHSPHSKDSKQSSYASAGLTHPEAEAESMAADASSQPAPAPVTEKEPAAVAPSDVTVAKQPPLPEHVAYVLIGAGTASFACMKAIRERDPNAKVLIIGEEDYNPYMRPPLSKALWLEENHENARQLKFPASWAGGKLIDVFYKYSFVAPHELTQQEGGASAVLTGNQVTTIDPSNRNITLSNGAVIKYDKCLIATGGKPKTLPMFSEGSDKLKSKVSVYRNINDYLQLDDVAMQKKSVLVVGGGFLGSELAVGLASRGKPNNLQITQVFPEVGNLGLVLPAELSKWTTDKVRKEGVTVLPGVVVSSANVNENDKVTVKLSNGDEMTVDHIVVAVGLQADTRLSTSSSGIEVDPDVGGYRVNSELQACTDVWVAGDVSSFYDPHLGRRRVEHHDHANVTGRLAGENMTGAQKQFNHQSMFWSDVGPEVGFEAVGLIDAKLETVGVWAKTTKDDKAAEGSPDVLPTDNYSKGVVFYLREKRIVGVLTWNCFGKMDVARKLIANNSTKADINNYIKDFDIHA
ncbi:apoptosis-inducing factor 1, mitochondrial-like [Dysidea avara]|uniref:apoptosis-inducing factor 1, mitochondrial-like n=1 Tax=Dysidea avara TaxID=196820 RepID=UPI00332C4029